MIMAVSYLGGVSGITGGVWWAWVAISLISTVLAWGSSCLIEMADQRNRRQKRALAELHEANAKIEAASAENAGLHAQLLVHAREAGVLDERQQMAREIHDTLAQGLTGILTQLQAAQVTRADDRHVANAIDLARESLTEARRTVHALEPEVLAEARLPEAIGDVARRWSQVYGIDATLTTTGDPRPMHAEVEVTLLRTAQEALANVAKHARAGPRRSDPVVHGRDGDAGRPRRRGGFRPRRAAGQGVGGRRVRADRPAASGAASGGPARHRVRAGRRHRDLGVPPGHRDRSGAVVPYCVPVRCQNLRWVEAMKSPLRPGDPSSLGGYRLLARLGEGGMGSVFLSRRDDGPLVAIKMIKPEYAQEEEFRGRFRSEVKRAWQVPPFCTAAVLDADPEHRTPYLVVEYVDGPSLDEVVAREGPLADSRLHGVAVGVATALTAIHGAGVIHRDLKPQNVLFSLGSPKVIDFGIARALEVTSQHTHPDQMVGTVAYMAPERFDGNHRDITPAADVFAWGAVIAFAGTGRTPFRADSPVATAARILTQPPDLTGLTGPLADLVALALAKDPEDRPAAHELLNLLLAQNTDPRAISRRPALDPRLREAAEAAQLSGRHVSGGGRRPGRPVVERPGRRRRVRTIIVATTAATLVLGAAGWYGRRLGDGEAGQPRTVAAMAAMPVPGAVRGAWVVDALDRPGQWKATTDDYGGRCSFKGGLVMTTPSFAMVCPGAGQTFAGDQAISADVTVSNARSCAEVQFRSAGEGSYWLDLCPQLVRLRHEGSLRATTLGSAAVDLFAPGRQHRVQLSLRDDVASVAVDGNAVLEQALTDPSLLAGKVAFGVGPTDQTRDSDAVAGAVVARAEIRPIEDAPSSPAAAALAFTDVRQGSTKSIVAVRGYYPKSRSVVVEPVLFMTGDEYCKTFSLKSSSDTPCEQAWLTEDSRMVVTLPTSAAPKLFSTFDDPGRCAGDPVTVGTCAIGAAKLAERLGTNGLVELTTTNGIVTAMSDVYVP